MNRICIKHGRLIDPSQGIDRVEEVWIEGNKVVGIGPQPQGRPADQVIDAKGLIVCPGLIDMHTHLCEPGREEDETIRTGTAAALAGGITSVACMPNTEPSLDNQAAAEFISLQAQRSGFANVFPVGALTKGRKGAELAEIGGLVDGGAVALSDDDAPVTSAEMMRRGMEYCRMFDRAVLSHCEDLDLTRGGVMHEGYESTRLGMRGLPAAAEEVMVYRDIALAELTKSRLHILHVSTARSVDLIRRGQADGVQVTGEVTPHHLTLTDHCLSTFESNYRMMPPLRSREDTEALLAGLQDGTLGVIASDHSPVAPEKKMRELDYTPNGVIGLETLLPVCITELIVPGHLTWLKLIEKLTINPARILGIARGTLKPGAIADVTLIDPSIDWVVDPTRFKGKSRNTPFAGKQVRGKAVMVLLGGIIKMDLRSTSAT